MSLDGLLSSLVIEVALIALLILLVGVLIGVVVAAARSGPTVMSVSLSAGLKPVLWLVVGALGVEC